MKCRQTCQGDPWQRMSAAEKKPWGAAEGRPPPFLNCRGHPLPFPLHFCLHFIGGSMVNHYCFSDAYANANLNANANAFFVPNA